MDVNISGQDLEALKRAATFLGIEVDDLLHFRRERIDPPPCRHSPYVFDQVIETGGYHHGQSNDASPLLFSPTEHYQQYRGMRAPPVPTLVADLSQSSMSGTETASSQSQGFDLVLLNPHSAQYACDQDYHGQAIDMGWTPSGSEIYNFAGLTGEDSWAHITSAGSNSDADDESASSREEGKGAEQTEQALLVPPATPHRQSTSTSSSSSRSRKRPYHFIAPRPKSVKMTGGSISSSPPVARKKRSPYLDPKKKSDTNLTRLMNACVVCKMQRNRVRKPLQNFRVKFTDCCSASLIQ
jgi:hypothetical protein